MLQNVPTEYSSNAVDGKGGFTGGMEDYKDTLGLGGAWSKGDPVTLIGDYRWTNYAVSIDAFFENQRENQYAQVGIRQEEHKILATVQGIPSR